VRTLAGVLLESRAPESLKEMTRAAERLHALLASGERWVYLKGGHLPGSDATDLLFNGDRMIELRGEKISTKNTHGTGCTLSSALATLLAKSSDVPEVARRARQYVRHALANADKLTVGHGHGPLHHFHSLWDASDTSKR